VRQLTFAACASALCLAGCAGNPTPSAKSTRDRQDEALRDPFHYKPDWSDTDVSGGDTAKFDKQGLKRDLDDLFLR
jgi:hypothetical protein